MPQKIRDLCPQILRKERIANNTIGHYEDDQGGSCASIRQILKWVPEESDRVRALAHDLDDLWIRPGRKGKVVIFTNQRIQANQLSGALHSRGVSVAHLHGKL